MIIIQNQWLSYKINSIVQLNMRDMRKTNYFKPQKTALNQNIDRAFLTEPAAIRLDSSTGELFGLQVVLQNLPLSISFRTRVVHFEAADRGGGPGALVGGCAIASVDVKGVLRLSRDVDLPFFVLHHGRCRQNPRKS